MPHHAQDFQVRIRHNDQDWVYNTMKFYLTGRHMIFNHKLPDNNHYHIYIFGLFRNADAIRDHLRKCGLPKENYAVSVTAGKKKEKIDPKIAYQYAVNPKSNPTIVEIMGFTDDELAAFKESADRYYNPPIIVNPSDGVLPEVIFKRDQVWERLKENKDLYKDLTVRQIKSKISAKWLNDGKAVPRPSDLHRYAISLFYICKYTDEEIPDDALEGEYN